MKNSNYLKWSVLVTVVGALPVLAANKPLDSLKFSNPRNITHAYLPLALLKQDILEGKEGGKLVRIERTAKPELHKTFTFGDQTIDALAVEDREFKDGELEEVAMDYFAQADDGTVLYLGEDVDEYKGGKVVGHAGSWLVGKDTKTPGVMMPAKAAMGATFKSEDVNSEIHEDDEIVSTSDSVTVPAGDYSNCVKVKETLAEGTIEYKYFAFGIGCVREVGDGEVVLKSHQTRAKDQSAKSQANAGGANGKGKKVVQDPLAREALALVGVNPEAEKYWYEAVHDGNLPQSERQDLIDDLNEKGLPNPHHPSPSDLPLIRSRIEILQHLIATLPDGLEYKEAMSDMQRLERAAMGSGEKIP
jgi:hypothetical protein